jgi:hypothetical protein
VYGKLGVLMAVVFAGVLALPALAGTEGTVSASVTPQVVLSVSLDVTSVPYGTLSTSATNASRTTKLSSVVTGGAITATNNGNSLEDIYIRGTNATATVGGESDWTLNCSPLDTGTVGVDTYVHRFDANTTFNSSSALALCTTNTNKIANDIAAAGSQAFVLQLNMPTVISGFGQRTMSVVVTATAP